MFGVGKDIAGDLRGLFTTDKPTRINIAYAVLFALFILFCARLVQYGMEESKTNRRGLGAGEWITHRADITDRNGELLAGTVSVDNVRVRSYAKIRTASHIVGIVSKEGSGLESTGQSGAEKFFDKRLRADPEPLVLSIDFRAQDIMHRELSAAKELYGAKMAAGILMDSLNGEIIAAVQLPDFDPENRATLSNMTFWPMRGLYEMGSTFKVFNTAAAYEHGLSKTKKYDVSKPFKIGKDQVRDKGASKNRPDNMTVGEILMWSSNIGSARVALSLPSGAQNSFFKKLGLYSQLEIDGLGLTAAHAPRKSPRDIEIANMAFGHGIAISMMNLIAATNAVINGGIFITPRLTKVLDDEQIKGHRVISMENSKLVREIMFRVSEETTGRLARIAGINIGSKTATAEKLEDGKYSNYKNFNNFIAFFPVESPRYILLVVLDEPAVVAGVPRTAAVNAVPTAGKILDAVVPMLIK